MDSSDTKTAKDSLFLFLLETEKVVSPEQVPIPNLYKLRIQEFEVAQSLLAKNSRSLPRP